MQNEAGGTGGGLLNRFAPKGVGIVPSVLRHPDKRALKREKLSARRSAEMRRTEGW